MNGYEQHILSFGRDIFGLCVPSNDIVCWVVIDFASSDYFSAAKHSIFNFPTLSSSLISAESNLVVLGVLNQMSSLIS